MAYFQRQDRRPSLDELKAHLAVAIAKWGPVVKDTNAQMERPVMADTISTFRLRIQLVWCFRITHHSVAKTRLASSGR